MTSGDELAGKEVRVWDLPVRLFHWSLAASVLGSFITVYLGEMEWHLRFGYLVACLVVFRLIWGFVGSETARFADFLRGARAIRDYLAHGISPTIGHSPLGGLSVLAILAALAFQVSTGLFSNDDIFFDGPWAGAVGKDLSDRLTGLHSANELVLWFLIGLHLAAIAFYTLRARALIGPMLTGRRPVRANVRQPDMRSPLVAVPVILVAAAAMGAAFRFWWF